MPAKNFHPEQRKSPRSICLGSIRAAPGAARETGPLDARTLRLVRLASLWARKRRRGSLPSATRTDEGLSADELLHVSLLAVPPFESPRRSPGDDLIEDRLKRGDASADGLLITPPARPARRRATRPIRPGAFAGAPRRIRPMPEIEG